MSKTIVETDTQTWHVTGAHTCGVLHCHRDADIIADTVEHERFCVDHTDLAALIPQHHPHFGGWYRITASTAPIPGHGVIFTVHPL
ncbi:hypothetical protein A5731_18600 [Mycolicibacterium conceptionense]|uniref:hypothetical protein n=1 Tax=Mycolicibacterium conceptionense TaxID=451644 RepID=UPI0007EB167D|nr:hypothetical protein [Mycolicibacterium conceptionense]OBB05382.1 hypothetical protein A5718_22900 [Mycolicibacterium conceptionense]OBF01285.1 hypothetical protein A5731_18600 [Mycolicibacterium conceptionense]